MGEEEVGALRARVLEAAMALWATSRTIERGEYYESTAHGRAKIAFGEAYSALEDALRKNT